MAPFKMQERDLDLFILEELHSDSGFDGWFARQIGLEKFRCKSAEHSVSAKANAKWGETDVFALFADDAEVVAVLIEDKIAAEFQDCQAKRYNERAAEFVSAGKANRYKTVLVAPQLYIDEVPTVDPWGKRMPIESLQAWFSEIKSSHHSWRKKALADCLSRVRSTKNATNPEVLNFSRNLHTFLQDQPDGPFSHKATSDKWGFIIKAPQIATHIQLAWKAGKNSVDLTFTGSHIGKVAKVQLPPHVKRRIADGKNLASDILSVDVPLVDMTSPPEDQPDVMVEVMAAIRLLSTLVPVILDAES